VAAKKRKKAAKKAPANKRAPARKAAPRRRGRPTIYTAELADDIIEWISGGQTLRDYCRQPGKPARRTIDGWRERDSAFSARFARARDDGFDVLAEECLEIANTPMEGQTVTVDKDGRKVVTEDMLQHRKLQIETRLKLLAKWDPRRYGAKVALGGDPDAPPIELTDAERATKLQALLSRVASRMGIEDGDGE
jgi:hypothetical protein